MTLWNLLNTGLIAMEASIQLQQMTNDITRGIPLVVILFSDDTHTHTHTDHYIHYHVIITLAEYGSVVSDDVIDFPGTVDIRDVLKDGVVYHVKEYVSSLMLLYN